MKTIGLLGGTGWSSTIGYYKLLNELVHERLGGYHSAKIVLKSIDYHDIASSYGKDPEKIANILLDELLGLYSLNPDCVIICCNSLHKYYDLVKDHIYDVEEIPVFHAVDLVAQYAQEQSYRKVLLLATKATMEDGFFARILEQQGIQVTVPNAKERCEMHRVHAELMQNQVTVEARTYFERLIDRYGNLDAVILGCTEYPLVVNATSSVLPIVDPVVLQCTKAVEFVLQESVASEQPLVQGEISL